MNGTKHPLVALLIAVAGSGVHAAEVSYDFTVCTTSKRTPIEANVSGWGTQVDLTVP